MYNTRPNMSPRGAPKAQYKHKGNAAAVAWWDNHVLRTHMRNPPATPGRMDMSGSLLSPRAMSPRGLNMSSARGLNSARSPRRMPSLLGIDKLFDPNQGRLRLHPLAKQLQEMHKGFKFLDVDGDGYLSPMDIARGLRNFNLAAGTNQVQLNSTNDIIARHMNVKGMVSYENFVHALAQNQTVCAEIAVALDSQRRMERDRRLAVENAKPKGPQLRPGVTVQKMREAQRMIKEKLLTKYSSLHGAFRHMDADGSGYINKGELSAMIRNLNLNMITEPVVDSLIDFVDIIDDDDDNDGGETDIGFKEFVRAFDTDDIMKMAELPQNQRKGVFKLPTPPPTPPPEALIASQVATTFQSKFKPDAMRKAFDFVDVDKTGTLTRAELRRTLYLWGQPLTEEELTMLFRKVDANGDGRIDYQEFCDLVANNPIITEPRLLIKQPALRTGVHIHELRRAQQVVKEHVLTRFKQFTRAFKHIDRDRTNTIDRDELKVFFDEMNLTQMLKPVVIETLIDFIDIDPGEKIEYKEFARVLSADDVMTMAPLRAFAPKQTRDGVGLHDLQHMSGAHGVDWVKASIAGVNFKGQDVL